MLFERLVHDLIIFHFSLAYSYQIMLEPFPFDLLLNLFSLLSVSGSKSDLAELLEIELRIESKNKKIR